MTPILTPEESLLIREAQGWLDSRSITSHGSALLMKGLLSLVERLSGQVHEAKATAGVCVNLFKGFTMLAEGKITEQTFENLTANAERDMSRAADWLNEYVGELTKHLAEAQRKLSAMDKEGADGR